MNLITDELTQIHLLGLKENWIGSFPRIKKKLHGYFNHITMHINSFVRCLKLARCFNCATMLTNSFALDKRSFHLPLLVPYIALSFPTFVPMVVMTNLSIMTS
jgi:hypothetical protein